MTVTKTIPAERLSDLDVHQGDLLRVVAVEKSGVVIQIHRPDAGSPPTLGKVAEWLRLAKGSVHLAADESASDARDEFYAAKYGVTK